MLAIKVKNISKQYRLGQVGTGTLSHDLNRFWYKLRGKEDPYLKIGEVNQQNTKGESDYVWALQDINFEIQKGEIVGIIGKNGAGKSTLLKILSKITYPTTGKIHINGRISSLLEVGTGFNPEMTGRENIYLNGTILGMTRKEISQKIDKIITFAEVERYIDTPVKRYSSGMRVRLAFSVSAHLDSEILIIDEVLAVGDVSFQHKCLERIKQLHQEEGRTILFVSHNMHTVSKLCTKAILLKEGFIVAQGDTETLIENYTEYQKDVEDILTMPKPKTMDTNFSVSDIAFIQEDKETLQLEQGKPFQFCFTIENKLKNKELILYKIRIFNALGIPVLYFGNLYQNKEIEISTHSPQTITSFLDELYLNTGVYDVEFQIHKRGRAFKENTVLQHSFKIEVIKASSVYLANPNRKWRAFRGARNGSPILIKKIIK